MRNDEQLTQFWQILPRNDFFHAFFAMWLLLPKNCNRQNEIVYSRIDQQDNMTKIVTKLYVRLALEWQLLCRFRVNSRTPSSYR